MKNDVYTYKQLFFIFCSCQVVKEMLLSLFLTVLHHDPIYISEEHHGCMMQYMWRVKPFGFQVTEHGITDSSHTSFQLFLYIFIYNVRFHYPPVGVTFPVHCVFCGL